MKILIIKPSSFGDIVQAAPCAAALKQAYPGCEITWVVFSRWESLVGLFDGIDKIITWDRKKGVRGFTGALKEIRKNEYDLAIDLQGLMRSAWLARFSKAKIKLGVPGMKEGSSILIKEVYPQNAKMNATLRNLEPLRFLTGKSFKPEVKVKIDKNIRDSAEKVLAGNAVKGNFISLLPFARGKNKNWSVENYLKLIELIKSKYPHFQIVVLGSYGDYGRLVSDKVIDLCGKTDIKQLAAVLSKSALAIGADTGSMHLASVLNIPSVFIFGASDINETAPYIGRFSLLINKDNPFEIDKVSPEQVFEEAEKWLK